MRLHSQLVGLLMWVPWLPMSIRIAPRVLTILPCWPPAASCAANGMMTWTATQASPTTAGQSRGQAAVTGGPVPR
jgi:hypothetical protein